MMINSRFMCVCARVRFDSMCFLCVVIVVVAGTCIGHSLNPFPFIRRIKWIENKVFKCVNENWSIQLSNEKEYRYLECTYKCAHIHCNWIWFELLLIPCNNNDQTMKIWVEMNELSFLGQSNLLRCRVLLFIRISMNASAFVMYYACLTSNS